MFEIRSFRNSDEPRLAMLWVMHHAVYRVAPAVTAAIWEQAIPARHFFRADRLLVATAAGQAVAWCHWFPDEQRVASLPTFCFEPSIDGEAAAAVLLAEVQRQIVAAGFSSIVAGVGPESRWGYQGLEPVGHGNGVDVADDRTNQLFEASGFEEVQRIDRWEVATLDYRPPVSREAIAFRRGTRIETAVVQPSSMRESEAMFHFEFKQFRLAPFSGGAPMATAEIWLSDPDIQVMSMGQSILGRVGSSASDLSARESAIRYLIASLIPALGEKHIRTLHRSVPSDHHDEAARLSALKFRRTAVGRLLRKTLLPTGSTASS